VRSHENIFISDYKLLRRAQLLQKLFLLQYEQIFKSSWLKLRVRRLQYLQVGPRFAGESRCILAPQLRSAILPAEKSPYRHRWSQEIAFQLLLIRA